MEIIGIDPGITSPSAAALSPKDGKLIRVASFSGVAPASLNMSLRAHGIALVVAKYVTSVPGPKVVGIEGPAYGYLKARTAMEQLARCRQAIFSVLAMTLPDILLFEIPPASAKVAITGKGNTPKEDVAHAVEKHFNVDLSKSKNNRFAQADAIAMAYCAFNRWKRET